MDDKRLEVLLTELNENSAERQNVARQIIELYKDSTDADAYYALGMIYEEGYAVTIDYAQAFYYYREGSKLNHANCEFALSKCYLLGKGCKKSYVKAVYYTECAVRDGSKEAADHLKVITEVIFGTEQYKFTLEDQEWLDKKGDEVARRVKERYPNA